MSAALSFSLQFLSRIVPTRGKATHGPQSLSIEPKDQRGGHADPDGDEAEQTVAPPQPQRLIHRRREQGEAKARQAAQHGDGGHGGTGVAGVGVDDVGLIALEGDDGAHREQEDADVRPDPVGVELRRPGVAHDPRDRQQARGKHERDTEFGPADVVVLSFETDIDLVHQGTGDLDAYREAEAEGDVVEPPDADRFVVHV